MRALISPDRQLRLLLYMRALCGVNQTRAPLTFSLRTQLISSQNPSFQQIFPTRRGFSYADRRPRVQTPVQSELKELDAVETARYVILKKKLEDVGIDSGACKIGGYSRMTCPECNGGYSNCKSFSLYIAPDVNRASWQCYMKKCGWKGYVQAFDNGRATYSKSDEIATFKHNKVFTEESIRLEPLCNELLVYFAERLISEKTLRRNGVMQKSTPQEIVIAFPYRRNGVLIGCKYRGINKRFWQEEDTRKILFGLDDIKDASDVIIVDGEIDKLSLEEAGFRNCVSLPDGAPTKVSEEDTKYQYLGTCNEYLDKASRIILATNADEPGQALAEELACRLGKERCWRVKWPKTNSNEVYQDANEVLMCLGPRALQEVIDQAELYPIRGLYKFSDFFSEIDSYYHHNLGYELGTSSVLMAEDGLNKLLDEKSCYAKSCTPVQVEHNTIDTLESAMYAIFKKKLEDIGIDLGGCKVGEYSRLICPECDGGDSNERSFSLYITPDANLAMWQCYRGKCGWRGHVRVFDSGKAAYSKPNKVATIKRNKIITEESIGLEPLCDELLDEKSCYAKSCTPVDQKEIDTPVSARYVTLKKELEDLGIDSSACKIGECKQLICPWCDGGDSKMKRFVLDIHPDGNLAKWKCYNARCGWGGQVRVR